MEPDYQVQGHCIRSPRNPTSILRICSSPKKKRTAQEHKPAQISHNAQTLRNQVPPRGDYVAVTWTDSPSIPLILSALPYVPAGPTIHQHDPRRHYLIYGRQSIRRQTRCACDVKSCALVLSCYLEMLMQVAAGTCLPPATWPIRSAPLPPGTWRETVSQSRRLRIRHRDPLPRRPWSPTLPPHTSPPAPPFPERPRPRATRSQGVPARLRLLLATLPAARVPANPRSS